jgi:hypothetical protein
MLIPCRRQGNPLQLLYPGVSFRVTVTYGGLAEAQSRTLLMHKNVRTQTPMTQAACIHRHICHVCESSFSDSCALYPRGRSLRQCSEGLWYWLFHYANIVLHVDCRTSVCYELWPAPVCWLLVAIYILAVWIIVARGGGGFNCVHVPVF